MQKTLNSLRMLVIMSLSNVDIDYKVNDNFSFRTWWEEREEMSDYQTDAFLVRENGIEYWKTLSIQFRGETIYDYSPTKEDIKDNFTNMVKELYTAMSNY